MVVKIAIVGAGYMAREHAKAFASLPGVELVGVVGRSRERADALAQDYATGVYDTVNSLYQSTRADAVVVTVTELAMKGIAEACFAHPWLCLLEKPVGIDLAEAEAILAEATLRKARAYVALNRRALAATRQALDELAKDDSPRLISLLDQQDMAAARAYGHPERVVRNFMYANSIHVIDYMHVFGRGEVVSVDRPVRWTPDAPGHVVSVVRFSSGDAGVYQAVWNGPGPWAASVTNRLVRLELRPLERLGIQRAGERRLTEQPPDKRDEDFKPGLRYQAEQVLAALSGAAPDLATLADATRSMRLCADIYGLR